MSDLQSLVSSTPPLPTLKELELTVDDLQDVLNDKNAVNEIINGWFSQFSSAFINKDVDTLMSESLYSVCFWRDLLSLTWDFRTFLGKDKISSFLKSQLPSVKIENLELKDFDQPWTGLFQPYEDIYWIQGFFTFSVASVGNVESVFRLVPVVVQPATSPATITWRAHTILTSLTSLHKFPEAIGPNRNPLANHGLWSSERQKEAAFEGVEPTVLIVGGGQSGLDVAARLKALNIKSLVIEKNDRVGDNWRNRYDALCLHDPVWYDHMPYHQFPESWPVYTPARKLGDWLESYASTMEINVWTSTIVKSANPDGQGQWTVHVESTGPNGKERTFKNVKHVIFATGFGAGLPKLPDLPGLENFGGQVLHSSQHKKAEDHKGKKVLIVGSCTSAHDIASDYYNHGVDVTMFQRSSTYVLSTQNGLKHLMRGLYEENGPPTAVADLINMSFSNLLMERFAARQVDFIEEQDKELLEGLRARGFRLNKGVMGAGLFLSAWIRGGGYYIDVGASKLVIDGHIKLKNDAQISGFKANGVEFDDGSFLEADIIIFATGFGDARSLVTSICGEEVNKLAKPIGGLDEEGELQGIYRDLGIKGLWYMFGNLCYCRMYSKHIALQIKSEEEGLWDGKSRFSLTPS